MTHRPVTHVLATGLPFALLLATVPATAMAEAPKNSSEASHAESQDWWAKKRGKSFERVATYPIFNNRPDGDAEADETSAEIVGASPDGKTLVYSDSPGKRVGFVDITTPESPTGLGTVDLTTMGDTSADAEPTSVYVTGEYVLVAVNTSESFTNPSGRLDVLNISDRSLVRSIDLGGQPDSITVSPDGAHAVIAIENERDEDFTPPGLDEGDLPQLPAGFVQVVSLDGAPANWSATKVDLVNADGSALEALDLPFVESAEDPEPEYVSVNSAGIAAVSLQENNAIVMIDLATKGVTGAFSAGQATVTDIDTEKDGVIDPTGSITASREPDAIAWIDDRYLATANEGDYRGGSRGWTIFDTTTGKPAWDAGNQLEHLAIKHGLHNESRAGKKGNEPEGVAVAEYDGKPHAFVASERSNFVAVYNVANPKKPKLRQVLPTGVGPEGLLPIPGRDLLVVASEVDKAKDGIRSSLAVYQRGGASDNYPGLVSKKQRGSNAPIGWGALSGLSQAGRWRSGLVAVSDNAYDEAKIYRIKTAKNGPAKITKSWTVTDDNGPVEGLDLEGISARRGGGYWLASEGKKPEDNQLIRVNNKGVVQDTVTLPEAVTDTMGKWGLEGVASVGKGTNEVVYFVIQRPLWNDPENQTDPVDGDNVARIGAYHVGSGEFSWFGYQLENTTGEGNWMGLSEITAVAPGVLAVVERDKLNGPDAEVKRVYTLNIPASGGAATGQPVTVLPKSLLVDALPALNSTKGWAQEKFEGFAIDRRGMMYAATDNDALKDNNGETILARLGYYRDAAKKDN